MREVAAISLVQFSIVYILLLVVLAVMKKAKINQTAFCCKCKTHNSIGSGWFYYYLHF